MAAIFRRPELARQMAKQLLHPGVLDEALRSGLFFSGLRRTGKTTFLVHDLIPALEADGAIVIYVDLWSDTQASPASLVHVAIRKALADLQTPASTLLAKLRKVKKAKVEAMGLAFGFEVDKLGEHGGPTLAQALTEVVDKAGTDVVLIVDEVQHAMSSEDGNQMLVALKSARDAINPRPGSVGHFIFVGTGSHRAMVNELITRRSQAFAGASSVDYPVLDASFVQYVLDRLNAESAGPWPSLEVAVQAFRALGHRPEELVRALRQLRHLPAETNPDPSVTLPIIAATMRSTAAEIDTARLWQMGALAVAIFDRVAAAEGDARGLFSADAVASYALALGREVKVEEIQPVVNALLSSNLIMRRAHGTYVVADPFVQEIWREQRRFELGSGQDS
jgi:hypothetical protein